MIYTGQSLEPHINRLVPSTSWDPSHYSQVAPKIQTETARLLLDELQRYQIPEDAVIIDFGSGDGNFTQTELSRIRSDVKMVLGIDCSSEMVQHAKTHHAINWVKYIEADISKPLPESVVKEGLQGATADLVYSANTLHHLHSWESHKQCLKNAACLLKPGGLIAFTFAGKGNFAGLLEAVQNVINNRPWSNYFTNFEYKTFLGDPETYTSLIEDAGFEIKTIKLRELPIKQDRQFWIQWLECVKGIMGYFGDAPKEVKRNFAEDVLNAYGSDVLTFVQLEVVAQLVAKLANPQNATKYLADADVQKARAEKNLQGFTLKQTDVVLDLGCGPGSITSIIAEKVKRVIGIDCDPDMIAKAREQCSVTNTSFELGDIRNLSLREFANVIICFAVLSWIPLEEHGKIFNECAKALKSGGRLLMRMSGVGTRPLQEVVDEVRNRKQWKPHFQGYVSPAAYENVANVKSLLIKAGFTVLRCEIEVDHIKVKSKEWMHSWLATWLPEVNHLKTLEQKEEFLQSVADAYMLTEIPLPGLVLEAVKQDMPINRSKL